MSPERSLIMPRSRTRRAPVTVPDAELAVLKVLWDEEGATIRQIAARLYPGGDPSHHATVQKLLERLQEKGCVARRRDGRAHTYTPTIAREELIRARLQDAAEKLCEGSFTPLLTQLVDGQRLSSEEVQALRELVDRLDRKRG